MPTDLPKDIPPTTVETIVPYVTRMPGTEPAKPSILPNLFSKVRFTHSRAIFSFYTYGIGALPNRLITDFEYNTTTGDVFYDVELQESDANAYAQLVTLNSWWMSLSLSTMKVAGLVMALESDVMYIASTFNGQQPLMYSLAFLVAFLVTQSMSLLVSMWQATKLWAMQSSSRVGDLVTNCSGFDLFFTYWALVSFIFFGLEAHVTDIVIKLHPWKSVQPFAAFKSENHRAFVIGYKDEQLFRVENQRGQFHTIPIFILSRLVMFGIKILMLVRSGELDGALIAAIVAGAPSLISAILDFVWLCMDRRILKRSLLQVINRESSTASSDGIHREKEACAKLLKLHFGIDVQLLPASDQRISQTKATSGARPDSSLKCKTCGRITGVRRAVTSSDFQEGQWVKKALAKSSDGFDDIDDAARGPLLDREIGEIVEIGPRLPEIGQQVRVRTRLGSTWWYNQSVLEKLADLEPELENTCLSIGSHDLEDLVQKPQIQATESEQANDEEGIPAVPAENSSGFNPYAVSKLDVGIQTFDSLEGQFYDVDTHCTCDRPILSTLSEEYTLRIKSPPSGPPDVGGAHHCEHNKQLSLTAKTSNNSGHKCVEHGVTSGFFERDLATKMNGSHRGKNFERRLYPIEQCL